MGTWVVINAGWYNAGNNFNYGSPVQLQLLRGANCAAGLSVEQWILIGSVVRGPFTQNAIAGRSPNSGILAYNRLQLISGTSAAIGVGATEDVNGYAIVQNVIEKISIDNTTSLRTSGDSGTGNLTHLIVWNNSFTGFNAFGRGNILYDDHASTARTHKLQSFRANIHVQLNHKTDIFIQNGARTAAWGYSFGVGCLGEFSQFVDSGPNLLSFRQDYPGLKANIGQSSTARNDPLFTSYAGTVSATVAGAGGGSYALQSGSPAIGVLTSAEDVLPFDLAGSVRDRGSVGAYR